MAAAKDAGGDYTRVEALLAEAGLSMPPMPEAALTRLKEREDWCFSTRTVKVSPGEMRHYVRKAVAGASPDYVLIAQTGQGSGPSAMQYFLVQGPLQLFLQIGWGGPRAAVLVNECFALAHQLVEAVPEAIRRGRLPRRGRLTVVASDRDPGFWEVATSGEQAHQPSPPARRVPRGAPDPRRVLGEAVAWCRGKPEQSRSV